jgi:hypothetical protein
VCTDWCEAGHCREGEGRLSCFGYDELYVCVVAVCLKSPCTARDGLRSRGRECYNIGVQRLTQRWQSVLKMTGTLWKNSFIIGKVVRMIHVNLIAIAVTFSKKMVTLLSYCPLYVYKIRFNIILRSV